MPKITDEQKELRKQQVLLSALEVFRQKGYEKATLKDIVEQAGMSRGWIYLYYSDKKQIFMDLLSYLDYQQETKMKNILSHNRHVLDILRSFFQDIKQSITENEASIYPAIYEFWITSWRDESARKFFMERYEKVVKMLVNVISKGIEAGEISPKLPVQEIVKIMMSNMDGIIIHCLAFGSEKMEIEGQVDHLLSRVEQLLV